MSSVTRAALVGAALLLAGLAIAWAADSGRTAPPAATVQTPAAVVPLADVKQPDPVVELNDDNFAKEVEKAKGLVLVDFFATWCGPCKAMKPIFHGVAAEYKDRLKFGSLDVEQADVTTNKYKIEGYPTLILFKDGKPVAQQVGLPHADDPKAAADALKALIDPYLK